MRFVLIATFLLTIILYVKGKKYLVETKDAGYSSPLAPPQGEDVMGHDYMDPVEETCDEPPCKPEEYEALYDDVIDPAKRIDPKACDEPPCKSEEYESLYDGVIDPAKRIVPKACDKTPCKPEDYESLYEEVLDPAIRS